jgi:DnaJ-class molecular chaperone
MVRGPNGSIPWHQGPDLQAVQEWRAARTGAALRTLEEYYDAHSICFECLGHGAKMIGWSDPVTPGDTQAAEELGLERLPMYDVCPTCKGTGKR